MIIERLRILKLFLRDFPIKNVLNNWFKCIYFNNIAIQSFSAFLI